MKVVGIIAEYNPFHLGHKYQIDKIREIYGDDTTIVAVMSGNLTQRGEIAIFDKADRAKAAVMCGVNLVLELPFPYSCSGAEYFAKAGVSILDALKVVDILSFGSECADISKLEEAASILESAALQKSETHDAKGYAEKCEELYNSKAENNENIFSPNNILGIEYIKAIKRTGSSIAPTTIKREGDGYLANDIESSLPSAMAIRSKLMSDDYSALDYTPKDAKSVLLSAIQEGRAPCTSQKLDSAIISSLRLNTSKGSAKKIHDADGGLYNRILTTSLNANSISSLTELAKTKKYTTARIRRTVWYAYFGVTSSEVKSKPSYTQILAMDAKGAALLKRIKKLSCFPVLTKPSALGALSPKALKAKKKADRVDSVLQLTKPHFVRGDDGLRFSPFVKK